MGLFIVGVILWILIGVAVVSLIGGLWKSNSKALLVSGLAFIIPCVILFNAEGWFRLLIILPVIIFALAYYTYKKTKI